MRAVRLAVIAASVVLLDQLTKAWLVAVFPYGAEREVIPGLFRLVHTRNRGIVFGLFGGAGPTVQVLLLAAVVAIIVFVLLQLRGSGRDGLAGFGLCLVLGGAIGNLIDRLFRGEVVDFLDLYLRVRGSEHHWPSFNVADSAISIGALLVILAELLSNRGAKRVPGSH